MKICVVIFTVAFLIRSGLSVFVFAHPERSFGFGADSYCYNDLAKRMIEYRGFSVYPKEAYIPEPARMPGYPFLLYIIYKIFGPNQWAVVLFQAILDSVTAVLIFNLLALVVSPVAGFIAGLLYAVNLHQSLYTTQILTETSFTFFLFLWLFFLIRYGGQGTTGFDKSNPSKNIIFSAFFLGIATLIREIAIYFPVFVCSWLILMNKLYVEQGFSLAFKKSKPKGLPYNFSKRVKLGGVFILVFIAIITPWGIRNYNYFGKFFISIMDDINLATFNAAPVIARVEKISEGEARMKIFEMVKNKYGVSDEELKLFGDDPRISKLMRQVGLEIIRTHPGIYISEHLLGFLKVFLHSELAYWSKLLYGYSRERLKSMPPISKEVLHLILSGKLYSAFNLTYKERLSIMRRGLIFLWLFISLYELFIYVLAFFGGSYLFRNYKALFWLIILTIFYFAFIPGPVGDGRFRVPIEPYISILAGCGIIRRWKK